jgi:hypothetical protein
MAGRALWLAVALVSVTASVTVPVAGVAQDTPIQAPRPPVPGIPVPAPKTAPLPDITPKSTVPPPEAQPEAKKPAGDAPQPPKNLEPIPKDQVLSVLGKKVLGPDKEDMGRVVDLLLDRDGRLRSVVIDFGGFLGVGSRKIAIDWRLVRFVPDNQDAPLVLSLGKADVQAAPEYKDTAQPPVMVGPQPPPQSQPQSQPQPQTQPPSQPQPQAQAPSQPSPQAPSDPQPQSQPQPQPSAAPDAAR